MNQSSKFVRTSTSTPLEQSGTEVVSLSLLESSLSVVPQPQTDLPELQLAQDQAHETPAVSYLQSDGEASSSVHEPPPLPGGAAQSKAPGDHSDNNQTVETTSQSDYPLYMRPFLSVLKQRRTDVKTQGQRYTIQDNRERPSSPSSPKKKYYEIYQGEAERP